jgi:hypothetical protein
MWHGAGAAAPAGPACLVVRPCLARVARWFLSPLKCVPIHKNYNITHGTLLVSKMCMKLVVYSSQTRGFDGRIFVVRTVNKLPQAKRLLVLEIITLEENRARGGTRPPRPAGLPYKKHPRCSSSAGKRLFPLPICVLEFLVQNHHRLSHPSKFVCSNNSHP